VPFPPPASSDAPCAARSALRVHRQGRGRQDRPGPLAAWARRCRIPAFVHLAQRITAIREKIHAALDHGLSNALIESVNTKIRLLTRIAFGFRSPDALIALAMLSLGGEVGVAIGDGDDQPQRGDRVLAGLADWGEASHVQSFDRAVHRGLERVDVGRVEVVDVNAFLGQQRC
jgi:hypothetical protein